MKARLETSGDWSGEVGIYIDDVLKHFVTSDNDRNITYNFNLKKDDALDIRCEGVTGELKIQVDIKG